MKVADENIILLERFSDEKGTLAPRSAAGIVYAAQRMGSEAHEHDGRGLIVAIVSCMVCWAALGYFLLA